MDLAQHGSSTTKAIADTVARADRLHYTASLLSVIQCPINPG